MASRAVSLRKLLTAPRGHDTTEGTLVVMRPPHGGSLQWETHGDLGEPGEANHV